MTSTGLLPEPAAELLRKLGARDRATRRRACDDIAAALQNDPELRDRVLRLLGDGTPEARFSAAWILFRRGEGSLRIVPTLLDSLEHADGDLRWSATHMLATLGRMHAEVLPLLLHEARKARSPTRRRMALFALRELAPEREETHAVFVSALKDSETSVQLAALSSFGKLYEPDRAAADQILEILKSHPDRRMRRIAAAVTPELVSAHPDTRERARPLLDALLTSADPALSRAARSALARLAERATSGLGAAEDR